MRIYLRGELTNQKSNTDRFGKGVYAKKFHQETKESHARHAHNTINGLKHTMGPEAFEATIYKGF